MPSLSTIARVAALGPGAWNRMARTAVVSRRIERSLQSETLDATARRFGATLSFDPPASFATEASLSEREKANLGVALAVLRKSSLNGTCLRRALVMSDILRDRTPILRVGVAKADGAVMAHAWIEVDGYAFDPMDDRDFIPLHRPES
jgi:hypothetical protein